MNVIKEITDLFALLQHEHNNYDKVLVDVTDEEMVRKPHELMNTIASIIEHVALVERKFMSSLANESLEIDPFATFKKDSWDVQAIRSDWADVLNYSKSVLEKVTEADLDKFGFKVGARELNQRQLIVLTILHTAHHNGQLPLLRKLLAS